MTGIIINNNEYEVNTGSNKIEYSSTGDSVSYSIWGEDIPVPLGLIDFKALSGTGTFTITKTGNYRLVLVGGGAGSCVWERRWDETYVMPGSSGGVFDGIVRLETGDYTYSIGSGGYGSGYPNSGGSITVGNSGPGGNTTLSFQGSIIATVGGGGASSWYQGGSGNSKNTGAPGTKLSGSIKVVSSTVDRAGYQMSVARGKYTSSTECNKLGGAGYSPDASIEERGTGGKTTSGSNVYSCYQSGVGGLLWIVNL